MTRTTFTGRANRTESGVAVIEFSFVLVLFVMLLWGIISFGYAWSLKEQEQHATQEGIRSALITSPSATTKDKPKRDAAVASAREKLRAMLGNTDVNEPTDPATPGGLHIETSNCKPTPPATAPVVCDGLVAPEFAECPTAVAGVTEPNTKCMTIKIEYDWSAKPKIAPLPGIADFIPSNIRATVTGKIS